MGNLQVRFLEGWAPAMAPGYSTLIALRQSCPSYERSSVSFWLTKWHEARGPWRVRRVRSHANLIGLRLRIVLERRLRTIRSRRPIRFAWLLTLRTRQGPRASCHFVSQKLTLLLSYDGQLWRNAIRVE